MAALRGVLLCFLGVILLLGLPYTAAEAGGGRHNKSFYDDSRWGFYWYEDPLPPEEKQKAETLKQKAVKSYPSLKDYSVEDLWRMDPDEFSSLREALMRKSIKDPADKEAMMEYFVMLDLSRRKSIAWANSQQAFLMEHPEYNVASSIPTGIPGRNAVKRMQQAEITEFVQRARGNYGLLYFYSANCEFCKAQKGILNYFISKYDWDIKAVDIDRDPAGAARFNVTTVPAIFLVSRDGGHVAVSVGVASLPELEEGVYRGSRILSGQDPGEWSTYEFERGGSLDPYAPLRKDLRGR